jgi:large subunit ribosomal protein L30e
MDINKALKTAVKTGKVFFGFDQTEKALKAGKARLIIVSTNCSVDNVRKLKKYAKVPLYTFKGTNTELGSACGKPFSVSTLSIIDAGNSEIMALGKTK